MKSRSKFFVNFEMMNKPRLSQLSQFVKYSFAHVFYSFSLSLSLSCTTQAHPHKQTLTFFADVFIFLRLKQKTVQSYETSNNYCQDSKPVKHGLN